MFFVDIWFGELPEDKQKIKKFSTILTNEESQRSRAFNTLRLSERFVLTRAILRSILSDYIQVHPQELKIMVNQYGKPSLMGHKLSFNLSHTEDLLMIAVSNLSDIGVDIERIKSRTGMLAVAERCFAKQEFEFWLQLSEAERLQMFYQIWTKKEAFVKAVGRGIALGMQECEIDIAGSGALLKIPTEYGWAADWTVRELKVIEDVCAALVTPNQLFMLTEKCFPDF